MSDSVQAAQGCPVPDPLFFAREGKHIPFRFREYVLSHVRAVTGTMQSQLANDPDAVGEAMEEAMNCALTGLADLRWYLLYDDQRLDEAAQRWSAEGVVGLCLYLRELHQAERILLVSALDGDVDYQAASGRLSSLVHQGRFTLLAIPSAVPDIPAVIDWARAEGVPLIRIESENGSPDQFPQLLEKLSPYGVCLLTGDDVSRRLAEIAYRKDVKIVSCQFGEWSR